MRDKDTALAEQCRKWSDTSLEVEQWIEENRELVGAEGPTLCKNLRSSARSVKRVATAASRKLCSAVFGPSQAGKSYLISALARDARGDLKADFCGRPVDFITEINPEGGKESTGLVTRFTTTPPAGVTPENPVRLRLFSEKDLVRVFANTYYNDCQHDDTPDQAALLDELKALGQNRKRNPNGAVTRDDIEDIREYMQQFRSNARVQMLNNAYWNRAAELAPFLDCTDRARLFGLIWNGVTEFTTHFCTQAGSLEHLGTAPQVSCTQAALLPREKSIIDVSLLFPSRDGSSTDADEEIIVRADNGMSARLMRRHVTALTAEITIYMPEKPAPFFEYTDLLDFPGYRSRLKTPNFEATLRKPGELETYFLRGKVAYLFERYCEEREITVMILCIGPGNQEVQDLPNSINEWVSLTQGASPADRRAHDPMLYFLLTKMDMEFEDKKGAVDPQGRWENRMKASLTDFFGRAHSWTKDWDGRPFRNIYLIRNPNVVCDVFDHDESGRETGIRANKQEFVEKIRASFMESDEVREHFDDPRTSWEAAMTLNDGGITLLRRRLAPICDPDRKYRQTLDRANGEVQRLRTALSRFYRADDYESRLRAKTQLGKSLLTGLANVVAAQRFADFLSRFLVSDHDLYEMAMACNDDVQAGADIDTQPITGTATSAEDLLGDLFGDGGLGDMFGPSAPAPATPAARPVPETRPAVFRGMDMVELFCRNAVDHWVTLVREQSQNPAMQRVYRLDPAFLESFADALVPAIGRVRLLEAMVEVIRARSTFMNITRETAAWRMASIAAYRINSFVSWLGHDARLGQSRDIVFGGRPWTLFQPPVLTIGAHGEPVVPDMQTPFDRQYYTDWFKAFFDCVLGNAASAESRYDPHQNTRLGELLRALQPLPTQA